MSTLTSNSNPQNILLLLNCDDSNCECPFFVTEASPSRFCSHCGHTWFFHAFEKIRRCESNQIRLEIVFNLASLALYATTAIPVSLKILLDRLLSKLLHSEVLQVIYALGWLYEDYVRGYKFFNQSLAQLDSWKTVSRQEEIEIIKLFQNFPETKDIACNILENFTISSSDEENPRNFENFDYSQNVAENPPFLTISEKVKSSAKYISQHISRVLREKPKSINCSKSLTEKYRLRYYRCFQCAKKFRSLGSLKSHRKTSHARKYVKSSTKNNENTKISSKIKTENDEITMHHGENCKCKKCKFLACNLIRAFEPNLNNNEVKNPGEEAKTPEFINQKPMVDENSSEKYLTFNEETDALEELKSLEALVSSVDFDMISPKESNILIKAKNQKTKDDDFDYDEPYCDGNCHLDEKFQTRTFSNLVDSIRNDLNKSLANIRNDKLDSESKLFSFPRKEIPSKTITISKDDESCRRPDSFPVKLIDSNLSWSELKNCSTTVREKLDNLLSKQEQSTCEQGVNSDSKETQSTENVRSLRGSIRSLLSCKCPKCGKIFSSPASMRVHFKNVHIREMHKCLVPGCNSLFNSVRSRNRHSMNANLHHRKSAHIHFL